MTAQMPCQRTLIGIRDHIDEVVTRRDLGDAVERPDLQHRGWHHVSAARQRTNRTSVSVSPRNGSVWVAPSSVNPLRV